MTSKFMGISWSQEWQDIPIWETFFNEYPIKTFIELGTGDGGMSLFFALQCYQRGIKFHTFDNQTWLNFTQGLPVLLDIRSAFHNIDIFTDDGKKQIYEIIQVSPKPLAIFFDDGDKPREWQTFGAVTSPGDFCIVHDWGVEFQEGDIGDLPVERILTGLSDARVGGWKSMWFVRK